MSCVPRMLLLAATLGVLACAQPAPPRTAPPPAQPPSAAAPAAPAAPSPPPVAPTLSPRTLRVVAPALTLSLLPAKVAEEQGFYRAQGIALDWRILSPELGVSAIIAGEADYSTTPTSLAAAASKGAPVKITQFLAAKLQHQLVGRPDLASITDLAGKRIAVNRQGDITAFEVRYALDHYGVRDVTLLSLGRETDRLAGVLSGVADATVLPVPADLIAERQGLRVLLAFGALLEVPLGGLGTSEDRIAREPEEVAALVRGAARAVQFLRDPANTETVAALIANWVDIPPGDARLAFDRVRDTYSPDGMISEAGMQNFLAMLRATDAIGEDTTAEQITDFRIARRVAAELGLTR